MNDQIACPRCQIGNLQPVSATYTCVQNGMLLSVPNMPAWKCDICQYEEFDYDALGRVEALTGHFGPPDDRTRPASKLPSVDSETAEPKLPHRLKP
jgi:YgiT-type zinc finger domain-containing protein